MGFGVGVLDGGRFHEVAGRSGEGSGDAAIHGNFSAADGIDDYPGGVGRIPDFEFHFAIEGDVPEGGAFHADVAPFAVGEPWDVIAGADVAILVSKTVVELAGDGVGFRDFLGFEAFALEHVQEIGVAAKVELVGAIEADTAFAEKISEDAMGDGGSYLGLNIIADDGEAALFESFLPIFLGGDKNGNAVDETATGFENLLDIPFGCHFGTDGKVVDDDVGLCGFQNIDDIVSRAGSFKNYFVEIFAQAVVGHAAVNIDAEMGDVRKFDGVIRFGEDGLGEIFTDFGVIDVECGGELDIADVVATKVYMHEARDELILLRIFIKLNALDERRCAIPNPDNCYTNFFAHDIYSMLHGSQPELFYEMREFETSGGALIGSRFVP